MRKIEKFKLNKNHITLIVVASVLLLSLIGYFVASAIAKNLENNEPYTPPDIIEGEDTYLGLTVAYPVIKESEILSILVKNQTGIYDLTRWPDENGSFCRSSTISAAAESPRPAIARSGRRSASASLSYLKYAGSDS